MDPYLSLAFALRAVPGAYAVLLGAGVSISAGIPAAWEVQQSLIRDVARAKGVELLDTDPDAWWRNEFGVDPIYDGVLDAVSHTSAERQGLLRPFFEPSTEERAGGKKVPSPAHRALAELVADGYVRVLLTTNFDFLLEVAIRERSIEPVVVSSPEAISGMTPLSHLEAGQCAVVHLHGDYLSDKLLNTADELGSYPAETDQLLDRVLDEYGLVIAGWSGRWDAALRNAILRAPGRRFATYWVEPAEQSDEALQLATHRSAVHVAQTADQFLPRVSDTCRSLADTDARHPLTVSAAIGTAKRELGGLQVGIPLHDAIRSEAERVLQSGIMSPPSWQAADVPAEHQVRLERLEAECEVLVALVATAAYWGDARSDRWWMDLPEVLSRRPLANGNSLLIDLARAPGILVAYGAGVAACAAGRDDLVASLLVSLRGETATGEAGRLLETLSAGDVLGLTSPGPWLHEYLKPLIADHLGRGQSYCDDWDRWELLVSVAMEDARHRQRPTGSTSLPYVQVSGTLHAYGSVAAVRLRDEVVEPRHPLLAGGLSSGDATEFQVAMDAVDDRISSMVSMNISSRMVGVTKIVPGPFYAN